MNKYYVYAHITKDTGEIFYIGKGSGNRIDNKYKRNDYWKKIVNKHGYIKIKLSENLLEEEAFTKEIEYIALYKSKGLCKANISLGGDGVRVEKRWWNEAISKSLKGKNRRSGKESFSYKDVISKEDLKKLYIDENKNSTEIAKQLNISITTVCARIKKYGLETRKAGRKQIKIKCENDGLVFNSMSDAAKFYGVYRENIRKVLKGTYKHTKQLIFKYENN